MKANNHLVEIGVSAKKWLLLLATVILVLGIFFRVVNLDKKPIWGDEAHTFSVISGYSSFSVISGYSESEVLDKLSTGKIVTVGDFLKYQYPNSEKNVGDTLRKLYTDVHPPLYFLMARYWVELFGHSVAALRSLSAVLSILAALCIYWLCLELFGSPLVGWMASALLFVSPIQVIYAQEARPYSLLSLGVLLSGASLLWAMRTQKKIAWFTYTASLVLGLYSQYFSIFVILGYLAYVLSIESFRFTQRFRRFLLATFAGFLAFLPWVTVVLFHLSDFKGASAWMSQHKLTLAGAVRLWSENVSLSFVDPRASEYLGLGKFGFYFLIPLILILVGYSIYFLRVKTSKQVYLFVFILIGSTALPLIAIDLILGGNRQIWPRYLIPCFLGIQICVAYLLSIKAPFSEFSEKSWQWRFWSVITAVLITAGVIFCSIIVQADTWWNKYGGEATIRVTQIIHQAKNPLIVVNRQRPGTIFFYNLEPEVKLLFIRDEKLKASSFEGAGDVFLLNPNKDMQGELKQQNYELEMLVQSPDPGPVPAEPTQLWKLKRVSN